MEEVESIKLQGTLRTDTVQTQRTVAFGSRIHWLPRFRTSTKSLNLRMDEIDLASAVGTVYFQLSEITTNRIPPKLVLTYCLRSDSGGSDDR